MLQDLRYALRTFAKTPAFTALAVLVLAIGIGANTAMFTLVNALMFKPLSGRADELVGVFSRDRTRPDEYHAFSYPNYADLRDQTRDVFDGVVAQMMSMVGVSEGDTTRRAFAGLISSNYFDALAVPLAAGRPFTPEEERPGSRVPVVIVGYDRWRNSGFSPTLLGSQLRLNGSDFTIVGVAPRGFTGTMAIISPELWLPLGMFDDVVNDIFRSRATGLADRANHQLILSARPKPGLTVAGTTERLRVVTQRMEQAYPNENRNHELVVQPLTRVGLSTRPQSNVGLTVASTFLMALAAVVLIIACLNIANMLLARGASRRREIAVRVAIGGGRSRIVRQLLTEGFVLAIAGAALGMVLGFWSNRLLLASLTPLMPVPVTFDPAADRNVLFATLTVAIGATILFALGPSLRTARVDVVDDLKSGAQSTGSRSTRRFRARNVLVVGQIALSLTLLCTGGLFARGALAAASADPGFAYDQLLLANIDPSMAGYDDVRGRELQRASLTRLRSIPGVNAVAFASTVPFGDLHEGMPVRAVGSPEPTPTGRSATYRVVGADYFRALGLRMVRGREFTRAEEESSAAPRVAIVDELLARRLFPNQDPMGQLIQIVRRDREAGSGNDGEPMEIIGIAPGLRDTLFDQSPVAHIYVPWGRNFRAGVYLYVRSERQGAKAEAAALAAIRQELSRLDPRLPVLDLLSMRDFHARSLELWAVRAGGGIVTSVGALALLLAVAGIYGVKSYLVSQRTREIGVRIAVGARPSDVLWMILREGLMLTAAGLAIGLILAALAGLSLSRMLYQVSPLDPLVFVLAPTALAASAVAATLLPARRATRVQPVTALRTE